MSNGGRITTELDIELAKLKLKTEEAKAQFRSLAKAAEDTKLGEKMEAGMKKSTVNEFRGFKERAEKAAAEAAKAAADKWKEIVTPALSDPWRVHQATVGGMTGQGAFGRGAPGGSKLALGNVAMQAQDIAVQAQMGTNALTIMAQQGSQLASIFGPTGMIIGGIVAVAGALMMAARKEDELFKAGVKGAKEFHKELESLSKMTGFDQIASQAVKLVEQHEKLKELKKDARHDNLGSLAMGILRAGTGEGQKQRQWAVENMQRQLDADELAIKNAAIMLSERDLELTRLKAEGREKEAAALERQLVLVRKIQDINDSELSRETKDELISNLRTGEAAIQKGEALATGEAAFKDRWAGEQEKSRLDAQKVRDAQQLNEAKKQLAEAERDVGEAGMNSAQKLVALNEDRLRITREISVAETELERTQLKTQRAGIEAQIVTSQMALSKEGENAYKARQEYIAGLQKDLAGKEKNLAKLENPTPTQTFRGAGALSSAFDWMFGGGSALVSESTDKNTDAMKDLREEIKGLKDKLADLNVNTTAVFQS